MFKRSLLLTACAVAFSLGTTGPGSAFSTYGSYDGSLRIFPFGCPDTSSYGEIITVPHNKTRLKQFSFLWASDFGSTGSMVVRAEVYAWNGTTATGASLWESRPRTISYNDTDFHEERFKTGGVTLMPGAQYIVFASIAKDYAQCTNGYVLQWGTVPDSVYAKGPIAYQNNGGDAGQWTTSEWDTSYGNDLAMSARFE